MRILYMPKPILLSDLDDWVKPSAKRYGSLSRSRQSNSPALTLT